MKTLDSYTPFFSFCLYILILHYEKLMLSLYMFG